MGPRREKKAKTRRMPIEAAQDYTEWMKNRPKPNRDDKGKTEGLPDPPQLQEPREHGTPNEQP